MRAELPPGPREPALLQTIAWARDPVRYMEEARARFGPIWTSRLVGFAPLVHVSDPDAVREVFTGDADALRAGEANRVLEPILGSSSMFLLDGARHLEHRRLVLPAFARSKMESYARAFERIAERELATWSGEVDASEAMQRIALDVILEVVLGLDPGAPTSSGQCAMRDDLSLLLAGATHPILLLPRAQRSLFGLGPWARLMRLKASIDARIFARIEAARAAPGDDVLSLLAAATEDGRPLDAIAVRDEVMTLVVAGHDTVATALAWALHHVTEHPAARREDSWIDAVVQESLRLTPVLPIVARRLSRDLRIGGVTIPRGARVAPNAYLAHRDPARWPEPTRFLPERFLGEKPSPYAFFPFGGGARRCIGMGFALLEMRVVLRAVLRRFTISDGTRVPGPPIRAVRRGVTLAPSRALRLAVHGQPQPCILHSAPSHT